MCEKRSGKFQLINFLTSTGTIKFIKLDTIESNSLQNMLKTRYETLFKHHGVSQSCDTCAVRQIYFTITYTKNQLFIFCNHSYNINIIIGYQCNDITYKIILLCNNVIM